MKYQLLLPFLLLSTGLFAQAKNDSKIIVVPADTVNLFDKLITLLYKEGYTVKTEDKTRGVLITEERTLNAYYNPKVRLRLFMGSTVTITGEVDANVDFSTGFAKLKSAFEPIVFKGMKGSILRNAWNEMDRMAKLIGEQRSYNK